MAAPASFHKYLEADVFQLLWEREPSFDVEETGTETRQHKMAEEPHSFNHPKGGLLIRHRPTRLGEPC
jgi:hypothetical protein